MSLQNNIEFKPGLERSCVSINAVGRQRETYVSNTLVLKHFLSKTLNQSLKTISDC